MSRAIGFVDRGELAAVVTTLGIAHPTGYPTITLVGHFVTRVLPLPPFLALNVFAALLVAAGAALLAGLFDEVLALLAPDGDVAGRRVTAGHRAALAGLAALAIALTGTWWQQADGFEVYALHAFFLPLLVWLFLRATERDDGGRWFGFCLGLALTNHLTTVLLAPAFALYAVLVLGTRRAAGLAVRSFPFILVGLLPYVWLPVRAAQGPRFDWGDPATLERFVAHVTGAQYRIWMFDGFDTFRRQTVYFFAHLPRELGYAGLLPMVLGLATLIRRSPKLAAFSSVLAVASVVYAGAYGIRDIDPYYLNAFLAIGIWSAIGLLRLAELWGMRPAIACAIACALLAGALHYRSSDESRNHLVEDLTANLLVPLPRDAILWTTTWDYALSASYYYQEVERLRPDVLVISPDLLQHSWYWTELERRAPALGQVAAPEARRYLQELAAFEHQRRFDPIALQSAYTALVRAVIERSGRPTRLTSEVKSSLVPDAIRVPDQLVQRLVADTSYVEAEFPRFAFRRWPNRIDAYVATTSLIYARALVERSQYEARHGREDLERRYLEYAQTFDPGIRLRDIPELPYDGRELVGQAVRSFEALHRLTAGASGP